MLGAKTSANVMHECYARMLCRARKFYTKIQEVFSNKTSRKILILRPTEYYPNANGYHFAPAQEYYATTSIAWNR